MSATESGGLVRGKKICKNSQQNIFVNKCEDIWMNTIINSFLCSTLRWNGVLFVAIFHKSWLFYCLSGGRGGDTDWASHRSIDSCWAGLGFPESGARVGMVNISRERWEWDPRDLAADTLCLGSGAEAALNYGQLRPRQGITELSAFTEDSRLMKIVFWLKKFEPLMLLLNTEGRGRKDICLLTSSMSLRLLITQTLGWITQSFKINLGCGAQE